MIEVALRKVSKSLNIHRLLYHSELFLKRVIVTRLYKAKNSVACLLINSHLFHRKELWVNSLPMLFWHTKHLAFRWRNYSFLRSIGDLFLQEQHTSLLLWIVIVVSDLLSNITLSGIATSIFASIVMLSTSHSFWKQWFKLSLEAEIISLHGQNWILITDTTCIARNLSQTLFLLLVLSNGIV